MTKTKLDRYVGVCHICGAHYTLGDEGDSNICDPCIAEMELADSDAEDIRLFSDNLEPSYE